MTDLNETLAQEAAELINGGEWRDGKWYSDGQRDAWRRALKPAASRIEKLEAALRNTAQFMEHYSYVWNGTNETHPAILIDEARKALEGKDD